jgi:hypothetical protein
MAINRTSGIHTPVVCTPEELMEAKYVERSDR